MRPHSFANSWLHKERRSARKARWVGAALVCLAILNGWGVPQATANQPVCIAPECVIIIPYGSTYTVTTASFLPQMGGLADAHAPFGSGSVACTGSKTCCTSEAVRSTYWPRGDDTFPSSMTLSKSFFLPQRQDGAPIQAVWMYILINLQATVYWSTNGGRDNVFVDSVDNGLGLCPQLPGVLIRVPFKDFNSDPNVLNTLTIEVADAAGDSYFDLIVLGTFD
jgi:hypothetical protein